MHSVADGQLRREAGKSQGQNICVSVPPRSLGRRASSCT